MDNIIVKKSILPQLLTAVFCIMFPLLLGTGISYAGGILKGFKVFNATRLAPSDLITAISVPIIFFLTGVTLFEIVKQNAYIKSAIRIKRTALILWLITFALMCAFPFMLYSNMLISAYVYACVQAAAAAALLIVCFKISPLAVLSTMPVLLSLIYLNIIMYFIAF